MLERCLTMSVESVWTLMKQLAQPEPEVRSLSSQTLIWQIPNPSFTPYKNVYHGGEENEKREVLYKHVALDGPAWLGELKMELSWHYWVQKTAGEFIVDQIRAVITGTRPNNLQPASPVAAGPVPAGAQSVAFGLPNQSWAPLTIPFGESTAGESVQIPLRDITVKSTPTSLITTYTFNLAFEYARRLRRNQDPDSFLALFGQPSIQCQIGSSPLGRLEQLRPVVERVCRELEIPEETERLRVKDVRNGLDVEREGKYRIVCDDGTVFHVEKDALARTSPVFAACFQHSDTKEERSQSYAIQSRSTDAIREFLVFCCTGHCPEADQRASELAHLAHHFQIPQLLSQCELFLVHKSLQDPSVKRLADSAGLGCQLGLDWLLLALHWMVEERNRWWTKEERVTWRAFLAENGGAFDLERYRIITDLAEPEKEAS